MNQLISNLGSLGNAWKNWAGFAGRTAMNSLQGSLEHTGRSATKVGAAAGAGLAAVLLIMVVLTTGLAALLMLGGLVAIWAICAAAAIIATVAGVTGWMMWKGARRSVSQATQTPLAAFAALPKPPVAKSFLSPAPHHSFRIESYQLNQQPHNNMNTNQIQDTIKSFSRELTGSVESFFSNNLGNSINGFFKTAWEWARKNPVPAGLIGAGVGGAALVATLRSGGPKITARFGSDGASAKINDGGLVNRFTSKVHDTVESVKDHARNGASLVSDRLHEASSSAATMVRDAKETAQKVAEKASDYVREKSADLSEFAGDASEKVREAASRFRDGAEGAIGKGTRYAKENPGTTAVGFLAAGLIAGLLLSAARKSDS